MRDDDVLKLNRNSHHYFKILKFALNKVIITTLLKALLRAPLFRSLSHALTLSDSHYDVFYEESRDF